jgi:hypothetical protein
LTAEIFKEGTGDKTAAAKEVKMAYNNTRSGSGQWNNGGSGNGQWNNGGGRRNRRYNNQYGGQRNDDPVVFDIKEHIGVLSVRDNGWRKEVNSVAWNGNPPKVDIRDWAPGYSTMSRGITLHEIEAARLFTLLSERYACGNAVDAGQNGVPRPVHAAPRDMQVVPGGADDTMDYAMRDIPFMDDHAQKPLPEDSPGELYEDSDEQADADSFAGCHDADERDADDGDPEEDYFSGGREEGEIA